jgi:DNA repair ATPase RecN
MNKQLFNRVADIAKENVELSAEKVELGLADELKPLAIKTAELGVEVNQTFDDVFVLLIDAEKAVQKLQAATDLNKPLVNFVKQVQVLETKYQKAAMRLNDMERELGVKIPFPADLEDVLRTLQMLQRREENLRGDVADYRTRTKKLGL